MEEYGLVGTVKKTILEPGKDLHNQSNPIYTLVVARGKAFDIGSFSEVIDDIVDKGVDVDKKIVDILPRKEVEAGEKEADVLATRKGSDAGDDPEERKGASLATKAKGQAADKARQVLSTLSKIPGLSEYASGIEEKWSIKVQEAPRELITATSLFHPYNVVSFPLYADDGPLLLMACIQWRLKIPLDSLELYTMEGVPMDDVDTLQKEKQCLFVDSRVTANFFTPETEKRLLRKIEAVNSEPFMLHLMALHRMNIIWLQHTLLPMGEELAIRVLKDDLHIPTVVALRLLALVKSLK